MKWKELAACQGEDTEAFYDIYENNPDVRPAVDKVCMNCPVQKDCFAAGVSGKDYGAWGGVYLSDGEIDATFNNHRTNTQWAELWENLTMEKNVLY